jgi:hypothetical protein
MRVPNLDSPTLREIRHNESAAEGRHRHDLGGHTAAVQCVDLDAMIIMAGFVQTTDLECDTLRNSV